MSSHPIPQIVAMGGGGFSMEPRNTRLDRYLLDLTGRTRPRVCFIPTASGDAEGYIRKFNRAFRRLRARPSVLSVFRPPRDMKALLLAQDLIYVGGGNTYNLLHLWRAWGVDHLLHLAWKKGIVLAGLSAGSLCWFEEGVTDSFGPLAPLDCLGFLPGSHCPHYDGEPGRRPAYHRMIKQKQLKPGYAADDGAALHFQGRRLLRVVTSRPRGRAYDVRREGRRIVETPIPAIRL